MVGTEMKDDSNMCTGINTAMTGDWNRG